jgi:AraC family transcriptional regulator
LEYRIETLPEKKLVGKRIVTTFANNKTIEMWRSFMPRRKEITNNIGTDLYSMQIYPPLFYQNFNPHTEFEKWATIEVRNFDALPNEMETFTLKSGLYAVFLYKGPASATAPFEYIFGDWIPNSNYVVDDRPHFEILGEKYKNDSPDSEEEIWIPIKPKG